jgi:hypothetical protein
VGDRHGTAGRSVRRLRLEAGPFAGVMNPHVMIIAVRTWESLGSEIVATHKAMRRTTFTGPVTSLKVVPFPVRLARQMRRIDADLAAFGPAQVGYRSRKKPQAVVDAAQKLMRDIRAVQATCSQRH